ncbi:hypothetical protein AGMMS49992_22170 [Clostridia bacterium]|nr:hypothetical protein AGMMS49992_22170 [Clostridia bacterium]
MNLKTLINEEFLKGFYPTPPRLVDRMLSKVDFLYVQSALEPSAGKGDIADALSKRMAYAMNRPYSDKKPPDLDAIEIDQNLRYILQGKGLRVVASDFLTFRTQKHYDLIVMNPPFEHGVTHLLKALELQEKGGAIICLLNAETLRNQHTYNRQLLSRKLTAYNAEIEYIQDAFTLAERKTDVEVALVRVTVPQAERESIIIERLRSSQRPNASFTVVLHVPDLQGGFKSSAWTDEYDYCTEKARIKDKSTGPFPYRREITEAKAFLKGICEILGLQYAYTLEEISKPFVVARVIPDLDNLQMQRQVDQCCLSDMGAMIEKLARSAM